MKSCVLGLTVDSSKDDKISCFHEGKKTSDGRKRLENQMKLSSTCELNEDAFTHTEEDIIAAPPSFTIILIFDILVAKKNKMFGWNRIF